MTVVAYLRGSGELAMKMQIVNFLVPAHVGHNCRHYGRQWLLLADG